MTKQSAKQRRPFHKSACVFVVVLVLALLGGPAVLNAQTSIMTVGSEGKLTSFASAPFVPSTGGEVCGKYFRFSGVPKDPTKFGIVSFVLTFNTKDNAKNVSIPMMGSNKLEIHLVAGKKVPTAKVLRPGGPIYPWIEISISPEDFSQAPCLVHSKVIRR